MDPSFIQKFNELSRKVSLVNEFLELKFGSEFEEFLTFKASRPNVDMILAPDDKSHHQYRDNNVGGVNDGDEEQEDLDDQGDEEGEDQVQIAHQVDEEDVEIGDEVDEGDVEIGDEVDEGDVEIGGQIDNDEDEFKIDDQDVSIDYWEEYGSPFVVTNVYSLKPEEFSAPGFDIDEYDDNDHADNADQGIPSSGYQSCSGGYPHGDTNDDEGDDSSAVYDPQGGNGQDDDASVAFFENSSPQGENAPQGQDGYGICPIPTTKNNPTIRPMRKKSSINLPPKGGKRAKTVGKAYIFPTIIIPKKKRAPIYGYYDFNETLKRYFCNQCGRSVKSARSGATSGLHQHLRKVHVELYEQFRNNITSA